MFATRILVGALACAVLLLALVPAADPAGAARLARGRGHAIHVPVVVHPSGTRAAAPRDAAPLRFSVPVPRSAAIVATDGIVVSGTVAHQVRVAGRWPAAPDEPAPVQWLAVDALCDHDGRTPLTLVVASGGETRPAPAIAREAADGVHIDVGAARFRVEPGPAVLGSVLVDGRERLAENRPPLIALLGEDDAPLELDPATVTVELLDAGPLAARVSWRAEYVGDRARVGVEVILGFWKDRAEIEVEVALAGGAEAAAPLRAARLELGLAPSRGAGFASVPGAPAALALPLTLSQGRPAPAPLPGPGAPATAMTGWRLDAGGAPAASDGVLLGHLAAGRREADGAWAMLVTADAALRDAARIEVADDALVGWPLPPRERPVVLAPGRRLSVRHLLAFGAADDDAQARAETFARPLLARPLDPQAINAAEVLGEVLVGDHVTRAWHMKARLPAPAGPRAMDGDALALLIEALEAQNETLVGDRALADRALAARAWTLDAMSTADAAVWVPALRAQARLADNVGLLRWWRALALQVVEGPEREPAARAALRAELAVEGLVAAAAIGAAAAEIAAGPVEREDLAAWIRDLARAFRLRGPTADPRLLDAVERDARAVLDGLWSRDAGFLARPGETDEPRVEGPDDAFWLGWLVTGDVAFLEAGRDLLRLAATRTGAAVPLGVARDRKAILHVEQFQTLYDVWRPLPLVVEREDEAYLVRWTTPPGTYGVRLKTATDAIGESLPFHAAEEVAGLPEPGAEREVQTVRILGVEVDAGRAFAARFLDRPPLVRHPREPGPSRATLRRDEDGVWSPVADAGPTDPPVPVPGDGDEAAGEDGASFPVLAGAIGGVLFLGAVLVLLRRRARA